MPDQIPIALATGHHQQVPPDWMPATGARPIVLEDPALVWLKHHGQEHGFHRDTSPYEFLDFVGEKGRQFEEKWIEEMAPEAVQVCANGYDVRSPGKVWETFDLMQQGTPVIVQAALWWAPERIYGVPDLLVHSSWLEQKLPSLVGKAGWSSRDGTGTPGHYVVFDMKFTSKLDSAYKAKALESYAAQVRIYSYMLGHLQGIMPKWSYLITRDRVFDPIEIEITSTLDQPLDKDLAAVRDHYVDIKVNGAHYLPWHDAIVASNVAHRDDQWHTAKRTIAWAKTPGGDPGVVYQISPGVKRELERNGFETLASMLKADPKTLPLEQCEDLGPARSKRIRAILQANRSGSPVLPPSSSVPPRRDLEFYVDFEYFTNINVDFNSQWPSLDGCEMIFMIGLGWEEDGDWSFRTFAARAEDQDEEREMLEEFVQFLYNRVGDAFMDEARASVYHWTDAEVWQTLRAWNRHQLSVSHPLRKMPWQDLQRTFLYGPIGLPGAWNYRLKDVVKALVKLSPEFNLQWPGDLDQGLRAMIMGWRAYEDPNPLESPEMEILRRYLEADCKALWKILKWMRSWRD